VSAYEATSVDTERRHVTYDMSYSASSHVNKLFHRKFSDCQIAAKFIQSVRRTCAMAAFYTDLLRHELKASDHFVLLFDESLNKTNNTKQYNCTSRNCCCAVVENCTWRSWKSRGKLLAKICGNSALCPSR